MNVESGGTLGDGQRPRYFPVSGTLDHQPSHFGLARSQRFASSISPRMGFRLRRRGQSIGDLLIQRRRQARAPRLLEGRVAEQGSSLGQLVLDVVPFAWWR